MGVLNATPDSFYGPSRAKAYASAEEAVDRMLASHPDIIDIGGESTRPGSLYISSDEEINRVMPILKIIRRKSDIPVSIDTRKAAVAGICLEEGADIINDISAMEDDRAMADLIAEKKCYIVLMHKQGTPETMQDAPAYNNTVEEVFEYLKSRITAAEQAGIQKDRIILDPGFGFGKTLSDNLQLLYSIGKLKELCPLVLAGASRKSMIGEVLDEPVEDRLTGTLVAHTWAAIHGADIIRVHDVREHVKMKKMLIAISGQGTVYGTA